MLPIVRTIEEATNAYYRNNIATVWAEKEYWTRKQISSLKDAKLFFNNI